MPTGLTILERMRPEAFEGMNTAVARAHEACPAGLLDLCDARIRMLLGSPVRSEDAKARAVGDYARSELFSEVERLALEFTEQYVMDVAGMPDDLVADLRARLGTEGVYALAMGLYAVDQLARLELSAAVHPAGQR